MTTPDYLRTFAAHHTPAHDANGLFADAVARWNHLTGSKPAPELLAAFREVAADDAALKDLSSDAALDHVYSTARKLWEGRVETGKPAGRITRNEAGDAVSASPEWKTAAKAGDFYSFVVHVETGEKLTHAQLRERAYRADGSYDPDHGKGFVNLAAFEFDKRVDAMMAGSAAPPVPAVSAPPAPPAPPKVEPAPTASGAIPVMSTAAAIALAGVPVQRTETPTPEAREPSQANVAASWGRTVERVTADMATTLNPGKVEKVTPGPGYGHAVGQRDDTSKVRAELADAAKVSAGWNAAIGRIDGAVPSHAPAQQVETPPRNAADDPRAAQQGWDKVVSKLGSK